MSPSSSSSSSSSSRWCPTSDQLMILEELYRNGIRTPNASQIQRITAHLSLYGKIEGKNVFYWFQNHKARDRQKLRRKLIKQLQHQQQQLLYPPPPSFLSHHNSPAFLPQGGFEMMSHPWKVEIPQNIQIEESMMRMYGQDWMMMMMEMGPPSSPTRPLETLELFPITTTNLKQEANNVQQLSASTNNNNNNNSSEITSSLSSFSI